MDHVASKQCNCKLAYAMLEPQHACIMKISVKVSLLCLLITGEKRTLVTMGVAFWRSELAFYKASREKG